MRYADGVSLAAMLVGALGATAAQAQTANITGANANVINLLGPFLALNGSDAGRDTLRLNLDQGVVLNNSADLARSSGRSATRASSARRRTTCPRSGSAFTAPAAISRAACRRRRRSTASCRSRRSAASAPGSARSTSRAPPPAPPAPSPRGRPDRPGQRLHRRGFGGGQELLSPTARPTIRR